MYCPTCGNEITVELKYCNRCGANLALPPSSLPATMTTPVSLTAPTVVIGLTIVIGLGIIFGGVTGLAERHVHPAAITWIILFSMATLFGCSALLIRFWTKMIGLQRQSSTPQQNMRPAFERATPPQLPPRFEPVPSVTEHTTRTFSHVYREPTERGPQ
ncbi:MAG: zinc ribbon domain-containing protein [Pyrinomonadaceae bacterium]|nr:zinc ribbon domain-containing protein [Pyrinomonadaceae bacterium]